MKLSLVLGLALVVAYVVLGLENGQVINLEDAVLIFGVGAGLIGACHVAYRGLLRKRLVIQGEDRAYVIVGAVCLIWECVHKGWIIFHSIAGTFGTLPNH